MATIDYLTALGEDGTALAATARRGLDPPVPACEGWTVADLVLHTGMVHRYKLAIVRGRLTRPPRPWPPPAPPHEELLGWYEEGLAELLTALGDCDPATPVWTFHQPDQTAGFWRRRMAQETVIHPLERTGDPALVPRVRELAAEATQ